MTDQTADPAGADAPAPAPSPSPAPENPHAEPAAKLLRRSRLRWRVLAFVALAAAVVAGLGRFALPDGLADTDRIARVAINGVIVTDRERLEALEALGEDDNVRAVVVTINSGGGSTAGGEELYEALGRLREHKPVIAVVNELGASAAYMTAIAADRVYARRLSIVGSIGVLYRHVNAGQLLDTIGIDLDSVTSGPLKAAPDVDEPMTGEVREGIEALVMDSFEWFVDVVAERRELSRAAALALSDGRIVTGRMALEAGLIDDFGGESEAIAWLEEEGLVAADLPVTRAWPPPESELQRLSRLLGEQARAALGLPPSGPVVLEGLVSLWDGAGPR